jgi:hypothetical protein
MNPLQLQKYPASPEEGSVIQQIGKSTRLGVGAMYDLKIETSRSSEAEELCKLLYPFISTLNFIGLLSPDNNFPGSLQKTRW